MILRGGDSFLEAGGVAAGFVKTEKFTGNNALDGAENRTIKRLHVAGGVNFPNNAVKGKEVIV